MYYKCANEADRLNPFANCLQKSGEFMEDILNTQNCEYIESPEGDAKPIDPSNPFSNPTENHSYNSDYSEIVPQIEIRGCKISHIPSAGEKRQIRRSYNIAGGGMLMYFLLIQIISCAIYFITAFFIMRENGIGFSELTGEKWDSISDYISNTSISPAITLLTYAAANLTIFFAGLKVMGMKAGSLFRTEKLRIPAALKYVLMGLFLQYGAGMIISVLGRMLQGADVVGNAMNVADYSSDKALIISAFYGCIVAPITEELVFRGFLMKSFSRVSQRFGIVMSALFFGLSHGNIAQFVLAGLLGLFMGYIDVRHNSLIPSILVHFGVNLMGVFTQLLPRLTGGTQTEIYGVITVALMAVAAVGGVFFVLFARKNIFPRATIHQQLRCRNVAATSATTVVALALYIIIMIKTTFY